MTEHLTYDEANAVANAILESTQYAPAARQLMLRGLPVALNGLMTGAGLPPLIGVKADLDFLNGIERLTDGSVPIRTFLRNALDLTGIMESMSPVRAALAKIDQATTGAPTVDLTQIPETKERITGGHNDMVPFAFMTRGAEVGGSVAKLEVPRFQNGEPHMTRGAQTIYLGTGWVIAPGLLITNHHVFNARNDGEPAAAGDDLEKQALNTVVRFDFDALGLQGKVAGVTRLEAADPTLDYAIVRLDDATRPALRVASAPLAVKAGAPTAVNVIQHPNGEPKKYGIRNNLVTGVTPTDVRYFTDTDGGSSGSPVLDDNWDVVALHRGSAYAKDVSYQGRSEAYVNLGSSIHAILADLDKAHRGLIQRPDRSREVSKVATSSLP